jgi:hypothetical protein
MNMTYEQRRDTIVTHAWEIWTKNGLWLDAADRRKTEEDVMDAANSAYDDEGWRETEKSVKDAVNNTYTDDITDTEWLAATLSLLNCSEEEPAA